MKTSLVVSSWFLKILIIGILGQTLFFKFTAHPESVALFTELGLEPLGRIGIGIAELLAIALIVIPKTAKWGAAFAALLMAGAIFSHITQLGWQGDRGELGVLAIVTFIASVALFSLLHKCKRCCGKCAS